MTFTPTISNGDRFVIQDVVGMTELNNREFIAANVDTMAHTLEVKTTDSEGDFTHVNLNSSGYNAYASGGTINKIVEASSPYLEADLPALKYVQSNDILFIVHPSYPPKELIRADDQNWAFSSISFVDGPYMSQADSGVNGSNYVQTSSSSGPATTLTFNGGTHTWVASDVGRLLRILVGSSWIWCRVTARTSGSVIVVHGYNAGNSPALDVASPVSFSDGVTIYNWQYGLWSASTGYPTSVAFVEDRLVFGGGVSFAPTQIDGSCVSDYFNFSPTDAAGNVTAAKAYQFQMNTNNFNGVEWLTTDSTAGFFAGTTGAEQSITAASQGDAISPLSINIKKATTYGSANIQAVQFGKCSLFVQRGSRKIREILPSPYSIYSYTATDLTEYAEHITAGGVTYIAIQYLPQPILWAVRADGVLLSMTYSRGADTLSVGWARHILGGVSGSGAPIVESVAVVGTNDGLSQEVWVTVQRNVNGVTMRYIELMTQFFDDTSDIADAFFLDSGLNYSGSAATTIEGLNHLNGESLNVWADGQQQASVTPVNGRVTLAAAASNVTLGYSYNSDGQKLRADGGSANGSSMGKTRRINRVAFNLLNTLGFKVGPDFDTLDTIPLDSTTAGTLASTSDAFTGIVSHPMSNDYDFDNKFCWRQSGPFPGTIVGIYPDMEVQDRG